MQTLVKLLNRYVWSEEYLDRDNSLTSHTRNHFLEHQTVLAALEKHCIGKIEEIALLMAKVLQSGGTIFWCGNGGSAADSQHFAAELVGRFNRNRPALRSVALTTDSSTLTCVANDFSFEDIFSRQIEALGRRGDLLVGISTSGNSPNLLRAFEAGKTVGLHSVGLLGKSGGRAKALVDHALVVPSDSTARIQEMHVLVGHCLCDRVEMLLGFGRS